MQEDSVMKTGISCNYYCFLQWQEKSWKYCRITLLTYQYFTACPLFYPFEHYSGVYIKWFNGILSLISSLSHVLLTVCLVVGNTGVIVEISGVIAQNFVRKLSLKRLVMVESLVHYTIMKKCHTAITVLLRVSFYKFNNVWVLILLKNSGISKM